MVSQEDLKYENLIEENTDISSLCDEYSDYILIFVKGSANPSSGKGYYLTVLNYKNNIMTFENYVGTTSPNRAMLEGIKEAVQHIKSGYKIMIVSTTTLGFKRGFNGKGANGDIVLSILEQFKELNCTLCECNYIGDTETYNRYVLSYFSKSKIAERVHEKKEERIEKAKYYKELRDNKIYNECLSDITEVLKSKGVDHSVIELVKSLRK